MNSKTFGRKSMENLEQIGQRKDEEKEEKFVNLLASVIVEFFFKNIKNEERNCVSENLNRSSEQPQHCRSANDGSGMVR
jgi:hemerythrin